LYFAYFPWGDEDQNLARFLRRASTVDSLAGTIVHRQIAIGLRQLVKRGVYPEGLAVHGTREYEEGLQESVRIASVVRSGKRPPDQGVCLFHHLYGAEDTTAEGRGRETIRACLEGFETSTFLRFLKKTNFDRWETILTNSTDVPSFIATEALGFTSAAGLRVYAAYDLALRIGDEFHLIDWKTGTRTPRAMAAAKRQLAIYGLWAAATQGVAIRDVRAQAVWLQDAPQWAPETLDQDVLNNVVALIEEQDVFERESTKPIADKNGEVVRYEAGREAFPTRPHLVGCSWCPYRSICAEGRAITKKAKLAEAL
jgi:hypothetical protein